MPERKSFLLRVDPETFDAIQKWAADELRSVNGQVEFLLRRGAARCGPTERGTGVVIVILSGLGRRRRGWPTCRLTNSA